MRSNAIRMSARGEECTLNIVGVCNYNAETTVLCHLPDESKGMSHKADDISAAYGCSACHDAIDGRAKATWAHGELDWYMRRAMIRTWRRLIALGIVKIAGISR